MENVTQMEWVLRQNTPFSRKSELMGLFEDARDKVQTQLVDEVFKQILECSSAVKYEEIDKSKGDITKLKFYDDMVETVKTLKSKGDNALASYANIVDVSIGKIRTMKAEFTKAFTVNAPVPIVLYETTIMSIMDALSTLIRYSVEAMRLGSDVAFLIKGQKSASTDRGASFNVAFPFVAIKSNTGGSTHNPTLQAATPFTAFEIGGGKKEKEDPYLKHMPISVAYLARFNESCDRRIIKKTLTECTRISLYNYETGDERLAVREDGGILALGIAVGVILVAIPLIREAVFYFYYGRMKLSDYCKELALYLEINKTEVKNNPKFSAEEKKSILDKQQKVMDKLNRLSEKLAVQKISGEKMASKEIIKKNKEITLDKVKSDIMNSDSTGGVTSDSPRQLNSGFEFE